MTGFRNEPQAYGVAPPEWRLPDSTRVGRVRLQVSELSRSVAYYTQVLGMRVIESDATGAVMGAADDTPLVELNVRSGVAPVPRGGRIGLYHFALLLPDRPSLARFVRQLSELGVRAGMSDHLVSEAIYLSDPDGLGIEVYADRPRTEWRHSGRQLVMATDPLDVADLVRAAGETPWTGMPAGTVMGHVHLHVSSLPAANAFWHEGVGFDRMVWSYPGALFLAAGGYHHHLGVNTWASGAERAGENDAQLLAWELVLPADAMPAALEHLARQGHSVSRDGADGLVADPDGTRLRLRSEPGGKGV
jgi:catechol 2,3-dioxygenase